MGRASDQDGRGGGPACRFSRRVQAPATADTARARRGARDAFALERGGHRLQLSGRRARPSGDDSRARRRPRRLPGAGRRRPFGRAHRSRCATPVSSPEGRSWLSSRFQSGRSTATSPLGLRSASPLPPIAAADRLPRCGAEDPAARAAQPLPAGRRAGVVHRPVPAAPARSSGSRGRAPRSAGALARALPIARAVQREVESLWRAVLFVGSAIRRGGPRQAPHASVRQAGAEPQCASAASRCRATTHSRRGRSRRSSRSRARWRTTRAPVPLWFSVRSPTTRIPRASAARRSERSASSPPRSASTCSSQLAS